MLNRDYIGSVSPPTSILVEAGQLRLFSKAIGETRDVYLDETAARAAGHRSILAPPTFTTCLEMLAPKTGPSFEELGIDMHYLLHGEEHFQHLAPIYAGDVITVQESIADIYEKKGGELEFMVSEAQFTNQFDELVQKRSRVLVMRYPRGTTHDG